jgi:hypothetical protein
VASAATFFGVLYTPWAMVIGVVPIGATLLGWHMGGAEEHGAESSAATVPGRPAEAS